MEVSTMEKSVVVKRNKNFKQSEVEVLLDLVHGFKDSIECKKTDHISQREKEEVWRKIEDLFNEKSIFVYRDSKTLKAKYENIKKVSKKTWAEDKKYVMGTGGGPSKSLLSHTDLKVKQILGPLQIDGHSSLYDSDCVEQVNTVAVNVDSTNVIETTEEEEDLELGLVGEYYVPIDHDYESQSHHAELTPVATNMKTETKGMVKTPQSQCSSTKRRLDQDVGFNAKYSVKDLRAPVSSCLNTSKKKKPVFETSAAGKRLEDLSKSKLKLVHLQRIVCEEQREIQRVEHELRIKCMEEEHKQKIKHAEEEHKEQLTLLKLKIQKMHRELL